MGLANAIVAEGLLYHMVPDSVDMAMVMVNALVMTMLTTSHCLCTVCANCIDIDVENVLPSRTPRNSPLCRRDLAKRHSVDAVIARDAYVVHSELPIDRPSIFSEREWSRLYQLVLG